ncbi:unnamed protein product [Calypogeia fissa]
MLPESVKPEEAHPFLLQFAIVDPDSEPSRQSYIKFIEGKSPDVVRWWSKDTLAVVTGGNKGVGFETVRQLANAGVATILTARDESRGVAAVDKLKAQGLDNVLFHPLDVTDATSAAKLASWIKEKFGGFDILVNNAGISGIGLKPGFESAELIVDTDYYGQKKVTSALLPLLRPSPAGARIINVSSELGQLHFLQKENVKQELNDLDHLTEEYVDSLAAKYLEDAKEGRDEEWTTGFGKEYQVAKILLNGYTRVLAKSLSTRPSDSKVYVNVMTPGLTSTDINGFIQGGRSVENGADTSVWLALFPSGGPHGKFLRDRADYSF